MADLPNFDPARDIDLMDWLERGRNAQAAIDALGAGRPLTPSADLPACRDEDPAIPAALAACYPDLPEYQHPENDLAGRRMAETWLYGPRDMPLEDD